MGKRPNKILFDQCRKLWNTFDPIGVADNGILDEYDSYVVQTVKLVRDGADKYKFTAYIEHCVFVNMGLGKHPSRHKSEEEFIQKLLQLSQKYINQSLPKQADAKR